MQSQKTQNAEYSVATEQKCSRPLGGALSRKLKKSFPAPDDRAGELRDLLAGWTDSTAHTTQFSRVA